MEGFLENSICYLKSTALLCEQLHSFEEEMKKKLRVCQCARTFRFLYRPRRKGEKKREWETPVSSSSLASIVIPLTIQQVGWNQCGLASAVVRSALRSSVLELWASLLPMAHRFSRDPEHGLPQRLTNFITTFSQLCRENQTNLPTHSQSRRFP